MAILLPKPKGFSLAAAAAFYRSFVPGSGMAAADTEPLTFAFRLDGSFAAVGVALAETDDALTLAVAGTRDRAAVVGQVSRFLGLDADGDAWLDVGRRDPVVGRMQREFPGFFTAAKASPYDAATWGVISPRLSLPAAAAIKMQLAREHGDVVTVGGRVHPVFPAPAVLAKLRRAPSLSALPEEKVTRLRAVAEAALAGRLDPERLRAMTPEDAVVDLQSIRGVGPWTASHVYFRGAAPQDALPTIEPRVLRGWGLAAGVAHPTADAFARAAEAWRPFRMWAAVLFARYLARRGEWYAPGLASARTRAIADAGAGADQGASPRVRSRLRRDSQGPGSWKEPSSDQAGFVAPETRS
jgi:DNA-3-methyladenine glycosylase II